jgi:tyrosyl-tRNA synthetase
MNFIEELKWRGLFHQEIPGTEDLLNKGEVIKGYIGFDPTAPSMGIGNMVQIIILKHFQRAGHQPIAVLGGATGMVGDPSGKSAERNLQTVDQLNINKKNVEAQLRHFLDFDAEKNPAILVDNYDFYKDMNVLTFLRDVGKHLTVNYMMAKDAVKSRMETGISYTEFSYQLLQAYDFVQLYKQHNCLLQMGGSDQWGNLISGVELIRRMEGGEVYAVTSPLVTKTDGTKFGKTEKGNVFLSADMTSPYSFYQFWLNVSDEDAEKFIKIFTFLDRPNIESLIEEHRQDPGRRVLQKRLAEEVTVMVHSQEDLDTAIKASSILFGKGTKETLQSLSLRDLLSVFEGVPQFNIGKAQITDSISVIDFLTDVTGVFASKSEVRRAINGNALSINSEKVTNDTETISSRDLINDSLVWVQNGKKNNYLVLVG